MKILIYMSFFMFCMETLADSRPFFTKEFKDRKGCFLLVDAETGRVVDQFNRKRCKKRFPPMSTFKIPFVAMGFESEYFKSVDQKITWDGENRGRAAVNKDQTPKTFIAYSVIWVSRKIIHFLGKETVQNYVNKFNYGNKKVAGDFDNFWLSKGSIKVSAQEQVRFLSQLWLEKLPLSTNTINMTKKATFDREIKEFRLYGKTGTGCIDDGCMSKPGRQLGWYVGVVESKDKKSKKSKSKSKTYAFALNFSDKKPVRGYGGPKAKKIVYRYLNKFAEMLAEKNSSESNSHSSQPKNL